MWGQGYRCANHPGVADISSCFTLQVPAKKARQRQLQRGEKCNALTEELTNLKAKRKCMQASIYAMTRSADQLSEKAEQTTPQAAMIAIAKSNAICRAAKEKASQIEEGDREVLAKEKELKG